MEAVRQLKKMLSGNVERFQGRLVFKAHKLLYHSTLGSRVIRGKHTLRMSVLRAMRQPVVMHSPEAAQGQILS